MHSQPHLERTVPTLDDGVTLLRRPSRSPALHRLVVAEHVRRDGPTYWIDARNDASTYALYELAPSPRALDDLHVARAFTAYQHHTLVRDLVRELPATASLVVAPCVASLYRDDDVPDYEARDLLASSLTVLRELGRAADVPVLLSASADDDAAALVADHADAEVTATHTDHGVRYDADGFETQVYWDDGFWQTTIPYWVELLGVARDADPATVALRLGLVEVA
ncbi:hypothetical protein ACFQH6_11120 [Halobacteriaceae archaeon GCM10025711]